MLSLNDVQAILTEMAPACVGGFIQKIQQPTPDTVIIFLRQPGRSFPILLSAHSQRGRLHVLSQTIPGSPTPPSFCQYLRARLLGARIHRLAQTPHDRIVWFELKKTECVFFLVVALVGRSANIFVLDAQTTVLRSLKSSRQIVGQPFTLSSCPWTVETPQELFPLIHDADEIRFPVSERIETAHLISEWNAFIENERHQRVIHLRKHIKKLHRRITKLTQEFEKVGAYRKYGQYGELLKSRLSTLQKGQKQIAVVDYFDEKLPELMLPLNPEKDGPENLKDYFTKYGKFTGAQKNLVPRLKETKNELSVLQNELQALECETMEKSLDHKTGQRKIVPRKNPRRTTPKTQAAMPYRHFCSQDGRAIWVGKSDTDNDVLTFKASKPDDLWLHARGTPGSHVVIKLKKRQQIPPETLKDAATLALFYSDLRKSGKGEVIYTLRKNVRKTRMAKPGSVSVTQEKSLWVFVDQARLDRLKKSASS